MDQKADFLKELVSTVRTELDSISRLNEELNEERQKNDVNPRVLGSILHDFYNSCERIFKRISSEINGGFYDGEKWHKELLYRMTLPMEGLRPAVVSEKLAAELDEYLSFRHVFRNIYGFELKGERLLSLTQRFSDVSGMFRKEIEMFLEDIA